MKTKTSTMHVVRISWPHRLHRHLHSYTAIVCFEWIMMTSFLLSSGEEYCLTESFRGECAKDKLIIMEEAYFGRMRLGRCVTRNYGNVGCSAPVLGLLDYACSGRWSCEMSVSDSALVRTKPCPKDFAAYLDATYRCVPGVHLIPEFCLASKIQTITETEGYIPGPLMDSSVDSSHPCNLLFQLQSGQRLNLTLYDFTPLNISATPSNEGSVGGAGVVDANQLPFNGDDEEEIELDGGQASSFKPCRRYAVVMETSQADDSVSVCAGSARESHVYISRSNRIQLQIFSAWTSPALHRSKYLLRFEVIGCADPVFSSDVYIRHEDDRLIVICNSTGETSVLVCSGRSWVGQIRNCTEPSVPGLKSNREDGYGDFSSLPQVGLSMVITFGVSLIVVIYVAVMAVCVMYIRRRRKRYTPGTEVSEQMTFLDGDDAFQLAISSSASGSAQRGLLLPRHEHCQLLLCTDRPTNPIELSPKYSRCSHVVHPPRAPRDHPRSSPGSGGRFGACACALYESDGVYVGQQDVGQDYGDTQLQQTFGSDCHHQHTHHQHHHRQHPHGVCGCTRQRCPTHEASLCCQDMDFVARPNIRGTTAAGLPLPLQLSVGTAGTRNLPGFRPLVESGAGTKTQKQQQDSSVTPPTPDVYIERRREECSLIDCSSASSSCSCPHSMLDFSRLQSGNSATTMTPCNQIRCDHALKTSGSSSATRGGTGKEDGGRGGKREGGGGGLCRADDRRQIQSARGRCSVGMESSTEEQPLRSIAAASASLSGDAVVAATDCGGNASSASATVEIEENALNEGRKMELANLSMHSGHLVLTTTATDDDDDDDADGGASRSLRTPINPDLVFVTGTPHLLHGYV